jgi:hypothetical protein
MWDVTCQVFAAEKKWKFNSTNVELYQLVKEISKLTWGLPDKTPIKERTKRYHVSDAEPERFDDGGSRSTLDSSILVSFCVDMNDKLY